MKEQNRSEIEILEELQTFSLKNLRTFKRILNTKKDISVEYRKLYKTMVLLDDRFDSAINSIEK